MPRQIGNLEVNTFVAGLITDASPLTFPKNASIRENNFTLDTDGSRRRRLGMDFEADYSAIATGITFSAGMGHSSYRWENAGGDPDKSLLITQFGNKLFFFDLDNDPISQELIDTFTFDSSTYTNFFSYAQVDGILVVANGNKDVNTFEYDGLLNTITQATQTLRIRDLFGVEDVIDDVDLRVSNNVTIRPTTETDEHLYNLRNQSWGVPRRDDTAETLGDPITEYKGVDSNKYPSNADTVTAALFANPNDADNRIVERFNPEFVRDNPRGNSHAPTGHFIIDALERGTSRAAAYADMIEKYSSTTMIDITDLNLDKTPGGSSVIAQFSGHVFYSGFSGEIQGGDSKSPRMSSYILFSRLVRDISDIGVCYQEGDPTSTEDPDVVQNDGGFIRLDEAYGIKDMVVSANSLFIFASNGVWRIFGEDNGGFKATGFVVSKLTDRGIRGDRSVVEAMEGLYYWGDDGIYQVARNQFGDWNATNISFDKVQTLYDAIPNTQKGNVQGYFDSYERQIRWVYANSPDDAEWTKELILDTSLGAFYTSEIYSPTSNLLPKVVGLFESNPFILVPGQEGVTVGGVSVEADGDDVIISTSSRSSVSRDIKYTIVTQTDGEIQFTFGSYRNSGFRDFFSVDDVGIDAAAVMITGYFSGGDFQRQKQLPWLVVHCAKTEDGFQLVDGQIVPTNQSSCKVQVQWGWSDNAASNRWGREFQAYRFDRYYIPADVNDTFETGQTVVTTKNKIRGKGLVISIMFSTEPNKDLHLFGWGMTVAVNTNV